MLDYRVYLSTSQILALREYNSNHKDFANEEIYGCKIVDDHYEDCKSIFLDIFRGETNQSKSLYGTIDEDYNGYQFFGD